MTDPLQGFLTQLGEYLRVLPGWVAFTIMGLIFMRQWKSTRGKAPTERAQTALGLGKTVSDLYEHILKLEERIRSLEKRD